MANSAVNIEELIKDPSAAYTNPKDVIQDATLDYNQKKTILDRWEQDAKALMRAEAENMTPPRGKESIAAKLIEDITKARASLEN